MIQTGSTLGDYEILAPLGKGGMGEVWRARDTKLGREVAIKLLPESLALDPDRLARFEREARVLASLNHPHIATLFGFHSAAVGGPSAGGGAGEAPPAHDATLLSGEGARPVGPRTAAEGAPAGVPFLVMELVEGETLEDRILRGRVPVDEAARIAVQIAEALEAAHEKGVVHRDLKPANVKLGSGGGVKVLDFGLAKALAGDAMSGGSGEALSLSPTLTQAMTGAGVLLGTAGYMSPEQARAKPVDRRSDIWAFGCVLYEMLAGRRAFDGETVTDILGAIVHKEPDLALLPEATPQRIRALLERCLRKEPDRRLQSIGDARIALEDWLANPEPQGEPARAGNPWLPWVAAAVLGVAGLAAGLLLGRPGAAPPEPIRRFTDQLGDTGLYISRGSAIALSPDGKRLAFVSEGPSRVLRLRSLDRLDPVDLATAEARPDSPFEPFFSPDGEWVGFMTTSAIKKVRAAGGTAITLAPVVAPTGASWGADDRIVFATAEGGIQVVPAAGGQVTTILPGSEEALYMSPEWLPGGKAVLFTYSELGGRSHLETVSVADGERHTVHETGFWARYLPTRHVLFADGSTLFALPFDPDRLEATGGPMPVVEGVETNPARSLANFDVSANGTLVYVPGSDVLAPYPVLWVDRHGGTQPLWDEPGVYGSPRLSPDGRRLLVCAQRSNDWDVWVYDLDRDVPTRLTFGPRYDADPIWSPDGKDIAYTTETEPGTYGIFRRRADGVGEPQVLLAPGKMIFPSPLSWSPDGSRIVIITTPDVGADSELWLLTADGSQEAEPFVKAASRVADGVFSPDGRFLAYRSDETGRPEIYVRTVDGSGKWQISADVGAQPRWSPGGGELFYRSNAGLMAVQVSTSGGSFEAGRPQLLFGDTFSGPPMGIQLPGIQFYDYDVAPDGQRFAVLSLAESRSGAREATVNYVTGWFTELASLTRGSGD